MEAKLPLKKVAISDTDYFAPGPGGSEPKVFGAVTPNVRARVAGGIRTVGTHFATALAQKPRIAAVAKVTLKDEAIAKSHRPVDLFRAANCPIVGVGGFGELLVSVRPSTLRDLERAVMSETSKKMVANISTIRLVEPFALEGPSLEVLAEALSIKQLMAVKLRLFTHHDEYTDRALHAALAEQLAALGIQSEELEYASGLAIFRLREVQPAHVHALGSFVGTQSLGSFPEYHVVRPAAQPVGKLTPAHFPPPDPSVTYPIVGIVDSGIDPTNPLLAPWVVGREEYIPPTNRDYEHGTFVAGLVVHARALNHGDLRFPNCPCRLLDVVALPKSGRTTEDELLAILREVIPAHPEVKVWNLSLAGRTPCSDHAFSDFAIALDELQTKHGVTIVLASGNYDTRPFRSWPPVADLGDSDRICGPADSTRALTVGSIAHRDSAASCVPATAPSPFSRRGPGPVHLPKPEVTHYGGNCETTGAHAQIGVLSVDANGNLAESIGTSFASPTVAAILANVQASPREPLSNLMAKALVIHSAVLANDEVDASNFRYRGFGIPADPKQVFNCEPWFATLLFELDLRAGLDLQRHPFPIPACLRDARGAFRGEMTVTLAYEPPLDGSFGAEYCRSNIDLSLGTYRPSKKGAVVHARQINPFPRRSKSTGAERKLVEHGFKWSPVKVYRRVVPNGVKGDVWRLALAATDRSGVLAKPIRVAMAITVADIERQAPVYNDVVTAMSKLGWTTTDVVLRGQSKIRT